MKEKQFSTSFKWHRFVYLAYNGCKITKNTTKLKASLRKLVDIDGIILA